MTDRVSKFDGSVRCVGRLLPRPALPPPPPPPGAAALRRGSSCGAPAPSCSARRRVAHPATPLLLGSQQPRQPLCSEDVPDAHGANRPLAPAPVAYEHRAQGAQAAGAANALAVVLIDGLRELLRTRAASQSGRLDAAIERSDLPKGFERCAAIGCRWLMLADAG